jgi:hypothetical protein
MDGKIQYANPHDMADAPQLAYDQSPPLAHSHVEPKRNMVIGETHRYWDDSPSSAPQVVPPTPQHRTILGLRRRNFVLLFGTILVIAIATIGGSIGGSLAVRNSKYVWCLRYPGAAAYLAQQMQFRVNINATHSSLRTFSANIRIRIRRPITKRNRIRTRYPLIIINRIRRAAQPPTSPHAQPGIPQQPQRLEWPTLWRHCRQRHCEQRHHRHLRVHAATMHRCMQHHERHQQRRWM